MSFRLYADLGNTTLHWAMYLPGADEPWVADGRVDTGLEFALRCRQSAEQTLEQVGLSADGFEGGLACSSNPALNADFAEGVESSFGRDIPMLSHAIAATVKTGYTDRTQIGLDRLANVAGLGDQVALPAVIVDAGSCITVDYVDADGVLVGGAIAPGLPVMKAGMVARTPHLQDAMDALKPPEDMTVPGRSTHDCIALGLFGALAATPQWLAESFGDGGRFSKVLTGGDAAWIQAQTGWADHVDELLTLRGLRSLDPDATI